MRQIVLSGTSHAGKTDLFNTFVAKGFNTVEESETSIVQWLKNRYGAEAAGEWILANYFEFKSRVAKRQARLESKIVAADNEIVIYDRSAICWIAYCNLRNIPVPPLLEELASQYKFEHVFFCEMLPNFNERREEGRVMKVEEAIKLQGLIDYEYRKRGYDPFYLPNIYSDRKQNNQARLEWIEKVISSNKYVRTW